MFRKHPTATAVTDTRHGIGECVSQSGCPFPIPFEQVKRNALGGLSTDTWHTTQRIDQSNQER